MAEEAQTSPAEPAWHKALGPAFLLTQASLLLYQLDLLDVWGDELSTLRVIASSWGDLLAVVQKDIHPPLYFAAAKLWNQVGWPGNSILQTRALSALFCLLATFLIHRLWLRKAPISTRFWFLALWVLSPTLLLYSRMARSYSLQLACTVVALHWGQRFIESPQLSRAE